jgi:YVTN family beta-propeller protein
MLLTLLLLVPLLGAQAAHPLLVVLNKDEATLATVDPMTGHVFGRVATGEAPHEVAVSPDCRTAFVANYGAQTPGSTISVIDLRSLRELKRVDVAPLTRPHGIVYAHGKVYFTSETTKKIGELDPATYRVSTAFETGQERTHMVLVNADATRFITANIGSNSININDSVIPVGQGPEGFDLSPDGRELWVANSRGGTVSIVDVAQKKVTQTVDVGTKRSNRLKFTSDGRTVLISDLDAGELLVVDVPTRKVTRRLALGKSVEGIVIEPDGSHGFAAVAGDDNIAVVNLKTLAVERRIETGRGPDGMAWCNDR